MSVEQAFDGIFAARDRLEDGQPTNVIVAAFLNPDPEITARSIEYLMSTNLVELSQLLFLHLPSRDLCAGLDRILQLHMAFSEKSQEYINLCLNSISPKKLDPMLHILLHRTDEFRLQSWMVLIEIVRSFINHGANLCMARQTIKGKTGPFKFFLRWALYPEVCEPLDNYTLEPMFSPYNRPDIDTSNVVKNLDQLLERQDTFFGNYNWSQVKPLLLARHNAQYSIFHKLPEHLFRQVCSFILLK